MSQLKSSADECLGKAMKLDKRFEDCMLCTCEVYAACVGTESSEMENFQAIAISLAVENLIFDQQKNTIADARAASDKLGKQMDGVSEAFKKASDNFPSG